ITGGKAISALAENLQPERAFDVTVVPLTGGVQGKHYTDVNHLATRLAERLLPHAVDKVWRALTSPHLVAEWLMENDFEPVEGHRFTFRAKPVPGWSGVVNCVVLKISPLRLLAYSWGDGSESDSGLKT
ncbi:SRPBCC domain-containing protein, partial [Mesorhizobium sp. M8A.F.Ca.ET.142.01.1.1]|uniref:SRPBCC family protein n=1 Tax=Mesorhizobium sp. M8A.F.Ca.ET.142.01.1.1 TaxID=2563958 RepID=UPI001FEF3AD8